MSILSFERNRAKLKALLGIRARLVLLALILVVPLMADRVRQLEDTRNKEVVVAAKELSDLARKTAESQREVVTIVKAVLKSKASMYTAAQRQGRDCASVRQDLQADLPWVRSISAINPNGKIVCSSSAEAIGIDLSDRDYYKRAQEQREFLLSDYIISRATGEPIIIAIYPILDASGVVRATLIAAIDLKWMSQLATDAIERPGVAVFMVDSKSVILGAQARHQNLIGTHLRDSNLLEAVTKRELDLNQNHGSMSFINSNDERQALSFARVEGTNARLIVSINEAKMLSDIDQKITTAYIHLALFFMIALSGAWFVGERLIIGPITVMTEAANKFGHGDLASRAPKFGLPYEFAPLASAFNVMASRLAEREREMMATNDRLLVMASVDMISGLANRRGFQSRLEFEWMKSLQTGNSLSLMMIDVDHFKLYNDTYGHPEGDACLARIGQTLSQLANGSCGFAARYGGEEFCLLLPDSDAETAMQVAEHIRATIERLAIPHNLSQNKIITVSVGVASICPNEAQPNDDLIEAADAALYAAKRRGRNTVVEHALIRSTDQPIQLAS